MSKPISQHKTISFLTSAGKVGTCGCYNWFPTAEMLHKFWPWWSRHGVFTDLSSVLCTVWGTVQTDRAAEPAESFPLHSHQRAQWHPPQEDHPSAARPVEGSPHWVWGRTPTCDTLHDGGGWLKIRRLIHRFTHYDITLSCPVRLHHCWSDLGLEGVVCRWWRRRWAAAGRQSRTIQLVSAGPDQKHIKPPWETSVWLEWKEKALLPC